MNTIDLEGSLKFLTFGEDDKCVVIFNGAYGHKNIQETMGETAILGGFIRVGRDTDESEIGFVPNGWSSSLRIGSNGQAVVPLGDVTKGFVLKGGSTYLTNNVAAFKSMAGDKIHEEFDVVVHEHGQDLDVSAADHEHVSRQLNSMYV